PAVHRAPRQLIAPAALGRDARRLHDEDGQQHQHQHRSRRAQKEFAFHRRPPLRARYSVTALTSSAATAIT
ncbi:MAG: hypothetical protein RMK99_17425, partial [Anaerolineales bacterium]|nr:hypothetical protein [Anaerolineales bacterium]